MKIALIPPFSLLGMTYTTNYQLMLPQLVHNERYAQVYKDHCHNLDQFVILDNGAAEGIDINIDDYIELAYAYVPQELVIPDTLGDMRETIEKARHFKVRIQAEPTAFLSDFGFMFVLQGQTFDEVYQSAEWAATQDWITSVGIPRHMIDTLGLVTARSVIANEISKRHVNKDIHFLGANPGYPSEMAQLANRTKTNQAYVRGMDTSMPFNFAYAKAYMDGLSTDIHRPDNYFELPSDSFSDKALKNNLHKVHIFSLGKLHG